MKLTEKQRKYLFSQERTDKINAKNAKDLKQQRSHGKQKYFNINFINNGREFEKGVSAPSADYIRKHKSQYFGTGIKITSIDDKPYSKIRTDSGLHKAIQKRHGYHVSKGTRVYDR